MDDAFFMKQALKQARIALAAGEFPVGAVLVRGDRVLAHGRRSGTAGGRPNEVDHAEIGALRALAGLGDAPPPGEIALYCTMEPCLMCYAALILTGIGRIVYAYEDAMGGGTGCDLASVGPLYARRRPEIVPYVLRRESLDLFKAFFASPRNAYWRGSPLADYTLKAAESPGDPDGAGGRPAFSN
jgi:tRNA(adenine34) deaminase